MYWPWSWVEVIMAGALYLSSRSKSCMGDLQNGKERPRRRRRGRYSQAASVANRDLIKGMR
jgi:hypothetical protein